MTSSHVVWATQVSLPRRSPGAWGRFQPCSPPHSRSACFWPLDSRLSPPLGMGHPGQPASWLTCKTEPHAAVTWNMGTINGRLALFLEWHSRLCSAVKGL